MATILSSARNQISNLAKAVVFGNIPDVPDEKRVSLANNKLRSTVGFDPSASPLEQLDSLEQAFDEMFEQADHSRGMEEDG